MPDSYVTRSALSTVANTVEDSIFGLKHSYIIQLSILFTLFMVSHQKGWQKASKWEGFPATQMELAVLVSLVSMFSHFKMPQYYQTSDGAWNQEPQYMTPTTNRPCGSFPVWRSCLAFWWITLTNVRTYTFPSRTLLWNKTSPAAKYNAPFLWLAQKNSLVWSQD